MLARLEQCPHAVFPQSELIERFPDEFKTALWERLVRRAAGPPGPGSVGGYAHHAGRTYVVVPAPGGGYVAFDDEDPEQDFITLTAADLARWTLDLSAVARRFQEANGLTRAPECIDPLLWFLGEKEVEETQVAYLLAFLNGAPSVVNLIGSLPVRLPATYRRFAVVCPSYHPSLEEARQLETAGVSFFRLDPEDLFTLPDAANLERLSISAANDVDFLPGADYRSVKWRGRVYVLTPRQAEVVGILHQAYRTGRPALSRDVITERMRAPVGRFRDIFKGSPLWRTLVVSSRQGVYRLDI